MKKRLGLAAVLVGVWLYARREQGGAEPVPDDAQVPTPAPASTRNEPKTLRLPAVAHVEPAAPMAVPPSFEAATQPPSAPLNVPAPPAAQDASHKIHLPDATPEIMESLHKWMWAFPTNRVVMSMDPKDPAFYDKLRGQRGARDNRYGRNIWSGLYIGIFSALPDYAKTTQFWMMLETDKVYSGSQLKALQVTFNFGQNSGPRYSTADFVSPFAEAKTTPYIHLPPEVMKGLIPDYARCKEVVILPFLSKTPGDTVEEFNGALYCRMSAQEFAPLGLMAFYRQDP